MKLVSNLAKNFVSALQYEAKHSTRFPSINTFNQCLSHFPLILGLVYFLQIWPHKIFDPWNFLTLKLSSGEVLFHSGSTCMELCQGSDIWSVDWVCIFSGVSLVWVYAKKLLSGSQNNSIFFKGALKFSFVCTEHQEKFIFTISTLLTLYWILLILPFLDMWVQWCVIASFTLFCMISETNTYVTEVSGIGQHSIKLPQFSAH